MKKLWILSLTAVFLVTACLGALPAAAADAANVSSSEEVLYARLNADGTPQSAFAVVSLNADSAGSAVYYGAFSSVRNLTDTSELASADGVTTADLAGGRFTFQGNLDAAALPWTIAISYTLDGAPAEAAALAGADGALGIRIRTSKGPAADTAFYDHYLLQITLTLPAGRVSDLRTEGTATVANSGSDKVVSFTVLPGTDGDAALTAEVEGFEMDAISISAVPYDAGEMLDQVSEIESGLTRLSDAVGSLSDGAAELASGAASLSDGAAELKTGAAGYGSGLENLAQSSETLLSASGQIEDALTRLQAGLSGADGTPDLTALAQLPAALGQLTDALDQVTAGLDGLSDGFGEAYTAMDAAMGAVSGSAVSEDALAALTAQNPASAALSALIANYRAAQAAVSVWAGAKAAFKAVSDGLPTLSASAAQVSSALRQAADQAQAAMAGDTSLQALTALVSGVAALAESYTEFDQGLASYTGGVDALADNWDRFGAGVSSVATGASALSTGAQRLSEGTSALDTETQTLPETVSALTGGLDETFTPRSFLSAENTDCTLVQFVFRTDPIETEKTAVSEETAARSTFWTRLLALFGL